jgi:hypothetical protein
VLVCVFHRVFWVGSFFFFFFVVGLGFELRASCLQVLGTPPVHFALVILEMESPGLLAWAGFQTRSSSSLPPK